MRAPSKIKEPRRVKIAAAAQTGASKDGGQEATVGEVDTGGLWKTPGSRVVVYCQSDDRQGALGY